MAFSTFARRSARVGRTSRPSSRVRAAIGSNTVVNPSSVRVTVSLCSASVPTSVRCLCLSGFDRSRRIAAQGCPANGWSARTIPRLDGERPFRWRVAWGSRVSLVRNDRELRVLLCPSGVDKRRRVHGEIQRGAEVVNHLPRNCRETGRRWIERADGNRGDRRPGSHATAPAQSGIRQIAVRLFPQLPQPFTRQLQPSLNIRGHPTPLRRPFGMRTTDPAPSPARFCINEIDWARSLISTSDLHRAVETA